MIRFCAERQVKLLRGVLPNDGFVAQLHAYASGTLTSGATGAVPSYAESTNYPAADLAAIKAGVNLVRNFMGSNNK